MGKVKVKKHGAVIDMTAMSDVTVLLLTFFMLTATFLPKEPIRVITPESVSMRKVPAGNLLTILVDPSGKVFLNLDKDADKVAALQAMGKDYGFTFNDRQIRAFVGQTHIGVPMNMMSDFLDKPTALQGDIVKSLGVPTDSVNNQLAAWVKHIRGVNENISIAIKADQSTPYPLVHTVMKTLVDIKENRYSLVTTLRKMPSGL